MLLASVPVATTPNNAPTAPVSRFWVATTLPAGEISTRRLSAVLPTTRSPLNSWAALIGAFKGAPAQTTLADEAEGPEKVPSGSTTMALLARELYPAKA